jgi:hypothetical protein
MRKFFDYAWRILLATFLLTAISFVSWRYLVRLNEVFSADVEPREMFLWLLVSYLLTIGVLTYPTVRSRWSGTQLASAIFVVYFGVNYFMVFSRVLLLAPRAMDPSEAALMVAHGFLVSLLFSFVLVLLMGRMHEHQTVAESTRLHLPALEWLWKLAVCAGVLVLMHVLSCKLLWPLGLGEYYGEAGARPLNQRIAIEAGRGLLLVAFILPVVKMLKGDRFDAAMACALLLSVLGAVAGLVIPSSRVGSDYLRIMLLLEGGITLFIYGFLVGYLFSRRPARV